MILGDTALTILLLLIDDSKIPTRNPYFFTPWFFIAQDMHDCFESLRVILFLQIWTHFRLTQALCSWMPESCQVLATLSTVKKRPSGKPELEQVFQIPSCHAVMASMGKQRVLACVWDRWSQTYTKRRLFPHHLDKEVKRRERHSLPILHFLAKFVKNWLPLLLSSSKTSRCSCQQRIHKLHFVKV